MICKEWKNGDKYFAVEQILDGLEFSIVDADWYEDGTRKDIVLSPDQVRELSALLGTQDRIAAVLALAAKLPSGLPDYDSVLKLAREHAELIQALAAGDTIGALTEVADQVYYAIKVIHAASTLAGVTVDQAIDLCLAKYALRAQPGNPKNDALERAACSKVVDVAK